MLFKPDLNETAKAAGERVARVASRARRRTVSIAITLLILGGLGYIAWTSLQQKQAANRGGRPDLAVPVLAATPRIQDVPVYLDGVGSVRALNNVLVRAQVDGKLISVNFTEGQDVKKGDVLGEIDPVIYKAQFDQAVAKKAQDEAQLANQRLDLIRYQQLAASNAGSKQQADTQRAVVAQQEALVNADQAAIDNAQATLGYTKIIAPLSGRAGLRQVDQGNIIHASDATGLVIITQLQPIAVQFSLPQQQIVRVNAASAKGALAVDVFGNDGITVVDTGKLTGIDNQVDPTTGTLKLKAEFPNASFQLWPGQFVNVRLKVETLRAGGGDTDLGGAARSGRDLQLCHRRRRHRHRQAGRGDAAERDRCGDRQRAVGLRSRGDDRLCQSVRRRQGHRRQGRADADGRSRAARQGQKRRPGRDGQKDGQAKDGQGERRGKRGERRQGEGDQKGQTGPAQGERAAGSASEVAAMTAECLRSA